MMMTGSIGVMSRSKCPPGCTCKKHVSYQRTPEILAKQAAAQRGRKKSPEAIAKRTVSRRASDNYGLRHGHNTKIDSRTPTYLSWDNMIQRCTNPNRPEYSYYGGRGITVCERWRDFTNFLADMGERPEGTSLDRIDGDGNYEPGNCRWADRATQVANRRRSSYYDRPSRVNECGHPEKPHKARGMCGACYLRWRLSRG
jgi:hypothetical protein